MTTLSTAPATETAVGQRGANKGCTGGKEVVKESEGEQKDTREEDEGEEVKWYSEKKGKG